jgi:hypothetical protein
VRVGARKRGRDQFVYLQCSRQTPSKFRSKSVQEAVAQSVQSCRSSAHGKAKITHAIPTTAHYCSHLSSLLALAAFLRRYQPLGLARKSAHTPTLAPKPSALSAFPFLPSARARVRVIILRIHFIARTPSLHRVHPPKLEAVHLNVNLNTMCELISSQSSLESLCVLC